MEPTKNHKIIRNWALSRRATPATLSEGSDGIPAVLRFIIPGVNTHNRNLDPVSWEFFFAAFDLFDLAFVFQNMTAEGDKSSLNEILQIQPGVQDFRNWH